MFLSIIGKISDILIIVHTFPQNSFINTVSMFQLTIWDKQDNWYITLQMSNPKV